MKTPRTDEALSLHYSEGDYFGEETTKEAYEFARGLERELHNFAKLMETENAEMRAVLKSLVECIMETRGPDARQALDDANSILANVNPQPPATGK